MTSPDMPAEQCFPLVDDDGQVIARVHGDPSMSPEARAALAELAEAARRTFAARCEADPSILERQRASRAQIRARLERLTRPPEPEGRNR